MPSGPGVIDGVQELGLTMEKALPSKVNPAMLDCVSPKTH